MKRLIKITDDLSTFLIYVEQRRKGQLKGRKVHLAAQTSEVIDFLKELKSDIQDAIDEICLEKGYKPPLNQTIMPLQ